MVVDATAEGRVYKKINKLITDEFRKAQSSIMQEK